MHNFKSFEFEIALQMTITFWETFAYKHVLFVGLTSYSKDKNCRQTYNAGVVQRMG